MVQGDGAGGVVPSSGVLAYELNTPLFSDYALKARTIWIPPGTAATYDAWAPLDLPVGSIVTKTFSFARDMRAPTRDVTVLETRVFVHGAAGWKGVAYLWDADQRDATLAPGGKVLENLSFTSPSGQPVTASYLVPSMVQCARCHADDQGGALHLLGPTARNMNREHAYPGGVANQIDYLSSHGVLQGAPPSAQAPRLPVWDDPAAHTVEQRARAWLEVNCAHCHKPTGLARTTGLFLGTDVTDPYALGICKPPVAAGPGTGGLFHDVVPGDPDASILVHRITSSDPVAVMPQIGRSLAQVESVDLVRRWIAEMAPQACP
jgi:uncharacterized repeat protein (TIGR03806 family)